MKIKKSELDHQSTIRTYVRTYIFTNTEVSNKGEQQQQQSKGQAMDEFRRRLLRKSIIA